ncbi:MAG TPA: YciI family protein [Streptosporangiaceae bacterium]|nr:YciI family protein [Streptosporangiaceae bacterium]
MLSREEIAMKYMILINASQRDYDAMVGRPSAEPGWAPEDFAALGAFMESFNQELAESGELVDTRGLTAPAHTRRIQLRDGVPVVTDGPYAEAEEVLAGYWIVECDSFDRATQIASRLTETPGPEHLRTRAYADVRPLADSRDELDI